MPSLSSAAIMVRDAVDADLPAIQAIYAHYVLHELATFELEPSDTAAMAARRASVLAAGLPWLVAEYEGEIVGYCYATPYRPRPAYRYTIEESIYLAAGRGGLGLGSLLMRALLERCARGPWRQMLAVIAMPDMDGNAASLALHRRFCFEHAGVFSKVGHKHGQWIDTVLMQRPLGIGAGAPPDDAVRKA
ncbi:MAG: L-methionine sulfoximine/L-methionine sulfone acetyltransferase [Herbaspirillum frisingense]|uniref:L-methionine sulfoximine/L-methionine sulfone acetyltransferase n=1 Tax=Herbaspirillum frisingense TaxID=92645 RepID=A0A7V8FXX8_9BURK|nr:MAG: L-methionine sulfoximine/L-methionine sulfone acetyltransferase [Herbaspirillum frisingense]